MKIGKMYKKSLRDLLKGPMAIHSKRDIIRYRNLERLGLVDGVGVRCVSLTKAGKLALATGQTKDEVIETVPFAQPPQPPVPQPSTPWLSDVRWDWDSTSLAAMWSTMVRYVVVGDDYV